MARENKWSSAGVSKELTFHRRRITAGALRHPANCRMIGVQQPANGESPQGRKPSGDSRLSCFGHAECWGAMTVPTLPLFAAMLVLTVAGIAYAGGGPPSVGPPGQSPDGVHSNNFLTRLTHARCADAGPGNGGDNGFQSTLDQRGNSPHLHIATVTCSNGPSEGGDFDPGNSQGNANNIP